jgi:hypothetical protein
MSRRRQAADGEVMVGAAASYEHGAQAAGEVAEDLREAFKEMVAFNILPATLWALRWSAAGFPTILNIGILRAEAAFWTLGSQRWSTFSRTTRVRRPSRRGTAISQGCERGRVKVGCFRRDS